MEAHRRNQLKSLLEEALTLPPGQHAAFLEAACPPDLRDELASLLQHHDTAFLDDLADALLPSTLRNAEREAGPPTDPLGLIGQHVSHYQIGAYLGGGGMGVVYKARDTKLGRTVALKFLPLHLGLDEEAKERFVHEAKAASALDHPNICTIYEIGEAGDGQLFIAMACYAGETLKARLARGPLELDEALGYAVQIGEGLQRAHEAGIVHRDVKPANVMVTDRGRVKLLDFGLAKVQDVSLTRTGSTLGTVAYMSPEQARGEAVDHRTDLWSLGVVLYEMLTGQRPFRGDYEQAVIYSILNEEPAPLSALRPGLPKALEPVAQTALAKTVTDRYVDMDRMLAALHGLQEGSYSGTEMAPVLSAERHMVGRARELAELGAGLEQAFAGRSLLLGVAGEAGIGKTTLVEAFLQQITRANSPCTVVQGQCSERLAGTEAYLPFFDVLGGLLQRDGAYAKRMRERAPWWYARVGTLSPGDPDDARLLEEGQRVSQEQVKRELAVFLQEATRQRPLVFFFEDLHWADVSTIDLLAYLGAKFERMRVLIVATYRPAEMALAEHPFLQIKPDLLSRGRCREVELRFLTRADVADYLSLAYPEHDFPGALAKLVHEKTEGSPLFMVDLVEDLEDRGVIAQADEGKWRLTQSVSEIRLELPDSVKGMIERKVQQLSEEVHRMLTVASVQGFEFDSAVVAAVLELDEEEVEEQLQELERDHRFVQLMEEAEYPDRTLTLRYRFVHVLYQNELYASLTRTKRARLSRAAAEVLEGFYGEQVDEVASELASLFETARDYEKAVAYFSRAAEKAALVFAYQESTTLAQRGLALLAKLPESVERDAQELELQGTLGAALVAVRGYSDKGVGEAMTRARELSEKLGLESLNENVLSGLILYFNVTVQLNNTIELCSEMIEQCKQESDDKKLVLAHAGMGIAEQFQGNFILSSMHLERVLELSEARKQPSGQVLSAWADVIYGLDHLAWSVWILGFPDQALAPSAKAKAKAEESRNPFNMVHYYAFAGFLYQCTGDVDKVRELGEKKYAVSEENAYSLNMAWANVQLGWVFAQQGELQKGVEMMLQGLAVWRAVGMVVFVPQWLGLIAEIYGQMNQPEAGLEVLSDAFDVVEAREHRMWEAELHRIKGELLLMQGVAASEVEACYDKALEVARRQEAKSFELRAAMSLSRLWQQQGKREQAHALLGEVYSWFTEGFDTRDLQEAKALLERLA